MSVGPSRVAISTHIHIHTHTQGILSQERSQPCSISDPTQHRHGHRTLQLLTHNLQVLLLCYYNTVGLLIITHSETEANDGSLLSVECATPR